jgi:hypothetical protein
MSMRHPIWGERMTAMPHSRDVSPPNLSGACGRRFFVQSWGKPGRAITRARVCPGPGPRPAQRPDRGGSSSAGETGARRWARCCPGQSVGGPVDVNLPGRRSIAGLACAVRFADPATFNRMVRRACSVARRDLRPGRDRRCRTGSSLMVRTSLANRLIVQASVAMRLRAVVMVGL